MHRDIFRAFSTCLSFTMNSFPFIIHIFLLLAAFSVVSFCPNSPHLLYVFVECYPKKINKLIKVAPGNQLHPRKHSFHIFNWFVNLSFTKTLANAQISFSFATVINVCLWRRSKLVAFFSFWKIQYKKHHPIISRCICFCFFSPDILSVSSIPLQLCQPH